MIDGRPGLAPVLISQSGESPEMLRLVDRLSGEIVAITNEPRSSLGRRATVTLPLLAGKEEGVTNQIGRAHV